MKKTFTLISSAFLMLVGFEMNAQTVLSEDFEGGTFPSSWSQTFITGGGWQWGANTALTSTSFALTPHTNFIATNDDGCGQTNCDKSNDFINTPQMDLTGLTSVAVKFDLFYFAGVYSGAQEVLTLEASTDGGVTWTVIETLTGDAGWRTYIKDISSFGGNANVKIGLRYNDGSGWTFGAAIDNFSIYTPPNTDMAATSVVLPSFAANGNSVTVSGTMVNYGSAIVNSMTLNYSVDNGTPVTQSLTGLSIGAINGTYSYSASTPWVAGPVGSRIIKVWATNINGNVDQNTANDEVQGTVIVASQIVARTTLIEEFTSSTCVPCANLNATFDPLLETNNANNVNGGGSDVSAVKYQMNWPAPGTDPSYNPDGVTRRTYYNVNGIPSPWIDGKAMAAGDQAEIDAAKTLPSPVGMICTYSVNGNAVTASVTVSPYITVPSGTKLFIAITEKQYAYTGTTTQTSFHHAMRKMLPNGSGTAVALVDGTPQTFTQSYTTTTATAPAIPVQNSYTLWSGVSNIEVVAFLQNTATKEILNSTIGTLTTSIEDSKSDLGVSFYPNPANDLLVVALNFKQTSVVTTDVLNSLGQVVYSSNQGQVSGSRNLNINTSDLANGIYFVRVSANGVAKTMKFSVAH